MESLADNLDFLRQLEYVNIAANRLFGGQLLGMRRTKRFGAGLEYADFRQYAPGDDLRKLYWQAYLQHRRLICKLYEESSEIFVYVLLDASLSMDRGAPNKLLYAKKLAAALAYVSLNGLDRVVVLPFSKDLNELSLPQQGRARFRNVLQALDGVKGDGGTDLGYAARHLCQRYPRRGLCILLSDFFDDKGYAAAIKVLHHNHYVVVPIRINEREEISPTERGDLEVVDCETGQSRNARITPAVLQTYRRAVEQHYAELGHLAAAFGYQTASVVTDTPFQEFLVALFRRGILVR